MPRVEREIVIHRPIEEVFDFMVHGRNEPHYNPHMLRAEQASAGPIGRGTRFRTEVATRGRSMEWPTRSPPTSAPSGSHRA